jgi:hypothetical protein
MKTRYNDVWLAMTLAVCATAAGAVEPSATLRQPQGRVFVDQSPAMWPGRDEMPLYPGNRVITVMGGGGEVVYVDGCTVTLPENSLLVIGCAPQCRAGLAVVRTAASFQIPGAQVTPLGVGTVAALAGLGAYLVGGDDRDNPPISR